MTDNGREAAVDTVNERTSGKHHFRPNTGLSGRRRVSGAGRRTKPGQVRPAVLIIAMGFSVLSCAARCALSRYFVAFALLWTPFLGSFDPRTEAMANIEG